MHHIFLIHSFTNGHLGGFHILTTVNHSAGPQTIKGSRAQLLSRVWFFVIPWTVAHQAPLSMGLSREEYWSGLPYPTPRDAIFWPKDWTHISCISCIGRQIFFFFLTTSAWEAPKGSRVNSNTENFLQKTFLDAPHLWAPAPAWGGWSSLKCQASWALLCHSACCLQQLMTGCDDTSEGMIDNASRFSVLGVRLAPKL